MGKSGSIIIRAESRPASQRLDHPHDIIFNESHFSIVTNEIRTPRELHGEIQEDIDSSQFYISDQLCIVADYEIHLLTKYHQKSHASTRLSPKMWYHPRSSTSTHFSITKLNTNYLHPCLMFLDVSF